jgi:hypothetical protein
MASITASLPVATRAARAGLWLLPVYGTLLGLSTITHQPPVDAFDEYARYITTDVFLVSHLGASIFGAALAVLGAVALTTHLVRGPAAGTAVTGLVLTTVANILLAAAFGSAAFVQPGIGRAHLAGVPGMPALNDDTAYGTGTARRSCPSRPSSGGESKIVGVHNCPMTTWELMPGRGLRTAGIELTLGMSRAAARDALAPTMAGPESHFPDEDDFTAERDGTWIRLRYAGGELEMIEFLAGDLRFDGIDMHRGTRWPALAEALAARGFTFHSASALGDGQECDSLGVNIATHEDVGGNGDGIEWVILAAEITT